MVSILLVSFSTGCVQQPVSGNVDEYACPTGYSWNNTVGACIVGGLDEEQKRAAKIAVATLDFPVAVIDVYKGRCEGCFIVRMQKDSGNLERIIKNWTIVESTAGIITSFEECVAAGYPVMESQPRQCRTEDGIIFVEVMDMTENLCASARGHWNECSNRCQLDNQGRGGVACPAVCEALCECGGIAGFSCPEGYECKLPDNPDLRDAMGYCVKSGSGRKLRYDEALEIARSSPCGKEGVVGSGYIYNENTKTWWFDFTPKNPVNGCNPACVVNEITGEVEINWRCTGLITE